MATQTTNKDQPWKKHWPPAQNETLQNATEPTHGYLAGEVFVSPGATISQPKRVVKNAPIAEDTDKQL
jgi:hypothetical protein